MLYDAHANIRYNRQELLDIGFQHKLPVLREFQRDHNIPDKVARSPGSPWIVVGPGRRRRRRRERKQKRGCRSGLLLRLRNQPHKPPLPSMYLTNARSIEHKRTIWNYNSPETPTFVTVVITETWLHPQITLLRSDRNKDSGKSRGRGLCLYVHNNWCNNGIIIDHHCSPDLEFMSVKCRPFFLPRELTVVIVTAVYIPPQANINTALSLLLNTINHQQQAHPNGVHIVAGDFNKANLKSVLSKFYQHVKCPTRGKNTLDHVYSNIKHAYPRILLPHLGLSDYISLLLTPAYTPLMARFH